jgi:hypothetical protein
MLIQPFDDMFNRPDMSVADEIFAPYFVAHLSLVSTLNRSSIKEFLEGFYDAFSDFVIEINDIIMTSDRLILRVTC